MSTKWTDAGTFANVAAGTVVDADVLPFADVSAAAGSRQRTITVGTLSAVLNGLVGVNSYAVPTTLDATNDRGHHVRMTAAGAVTIPLGLPIGWNCVVENATVSDLVTIAATGGVTLLSAGTEVSNGKWVALVVVNTNVVSAVGAFADDPETGGTTIPTEIGSAVTLYVNASTGDDSTGDGTIGTPYASIGRALEDIPTVVTARYTIDVADGTYREQVNVDRFVFPRFASETNDARIILTGNTSTPANCVISGADSGTPTTPTRDFCVLAAAALVTIEGFAVVYAAVRALEIGGRANVRLGAMRYTNSTTGILAANHSIVRFAGAQTFVDCGTGIILVEFSRLNTDSGSRAITMTGVTSRGLYVVESTALMNSGDSLSVAAAGSGDRFAGVEADGNAVVDIPVTVSLTGGFAYNVVSAAGARIHLAPGSLTLSGATTSDYITADNGTVWDRTSAEYLAGAPAPTVGTWTPVLRGGGATSGQTHSKQHGDYMLFGDWVLVTFDVRLSNKGTTSGNMAVYGLPFPVNSDVDPRFVGSVLFLNLGANVVSAVLSANYFDANSLIVQAMTAAGTSMSTLDVATYLTNTTILQGSIMYKREP